MVAIKALKKLFPLPLGIGVLPQSSACEHNFSAPNQRSSHISHTKTIIQLAGRYVACFFLIWRNPHIWSHIFDPSWKNFQHYSQKVDFFFNFSGICYTGNNEKIYVMYFFLYTENKWNNCKVINCYYGIMTMQMKKKKKKKKINMLTFKWSVIRPIL